MAVETAKDAALNLSDHAQRRRDFAVLARHPDKTIAHLERREE
jgi:hypothetical protein